MHYKYHKSQNWWTFKLSNFHIEQLMYLVSPKYLWKHLCMSVRDVSIINLSVSLPGLTQDSFKLYSSINFDGHLHSMNPRCLIPSSYQWLCRVNFVLLLLTLYCNLDWPITKLIMSSIFPTRHPLLNPRWVPIYIPICTCSSFYKTYVITQISKCPCRTR